MKKYEESIQWYDKAIELNSWFEKEFLNKGISLLYLKKYESAIQCFDKAIWLNP